VKNISNANSRFPILYSTSGTLRQLFPSIDV
jgi:hypothetical protein